MKIFGFEVQVASEAESQSYYGALSSVMENPRISVEKGAEIIKMFIAHHISGQQLNNYVARNSSESYMQQDVFTHLDRWQEAMGPFSEDDMRFLHSKSNTSDYRSMAGDIQSIVNYISRRVIGQDAAIKSIVTAAWLHSTSIRNSLGIRVPAQLLVGQTGVGKTQILNLLSEVINIPVINIYASTITAPGYKGGDSLIDQIFSQYSRFNELDSSPKPVIVAIHEIDKVMRGNNDGYRVELLSSIMSIIEKNVIYKSNPLGGAEALDLKNVLVFFDGCFDEIEAIVARRLGLSRVGFNSASLQCKHDLRAHITKADLIDYGLGMITELVGRIANPICLNSMTANLLYDILTQSKDSPIAAYESAFLHYGINLRFTTGALKSIAKQAFENGIYGARALESVVSELMQPYILSLSSKSKDCILIDKGAVSRFISHKKEYLHR